MEPGISPGELPPFHRLSEYTFESLCRDLLDAEASVETCDEYGTRGQRQYGVDLLAHRAGGDGFELGQCKRYASCTSRQIVRVREEFFEHYGYGKHWQPGTVKRFILFITCDLSSTDLQDTISEEREKFRHFGIRYEVWGPAKIRSKLRPHQSIVSTYLTPPEHWVRVICGVSTLLANSSTDFPQTRAATIVDSALLQRVGQLESEEAERRLQDMRTSWQEGRHRECIEAIDELKSDNDRWQSLSAETKSRVLRFEASVRLHAESNVGLATRLADEARSLSPTADETKVRALIAHAGSGPMTAANLLLERGDADTVNLRASFLFEHGDYQGCREALEVFDEGSLEPTASTAQLRALLNILSGEQEQAQLEAQKALEMQPRWEGVRFTAAMVDYLGALSPAALPHHIVWWPEPVDWGLVKRDEESISRLRAAAEAFRKLSEDVDAPEAQHRYEAWRLACMANDPEAQEDAVRYCRQLLAAEPTNYQAVLWAVARSFDVDLGHSKNSLKGMVAGETTDIPHALTLCRVLILEDETDEALKLLESSRDAFEAEGAGDLWTSWHAQALATDGDPQAALESLDSQSEAQEMRGARAVVLGVQAEQTGDWNPLFMHLESSYRASGDPTFLLDACELKARHEEWGYIADVARELTEGISTAEALRIAAMGAHNDDKHELCLELMDGHRGLCTEGRLPRELRQMRISCQRSLGLLTSAGAAAEELAREDPSVINLSNLFLLRLDQADRPGVMSAARRLAEHPDLSDEQALGVAEVILLDDRDLAISLWRKAVQSDLPDHFVSKALDLGFKLGLDHETAPLMRRALEMGDCDGNGLQRLTIQEALEFMERQHEHSEGFREMYLDGTAPIHLASEALNVPLANEYHRRFLDNEASNTPAESAFLLIEYGGRSAFEAPPAALTERRLVLDVTAFLVAEHLEILDKVEAAFEELLVSQELGRALLEMRDRVAPHQPSQLEAHRTIIRLADAGKISTEWPELPSAYERPELVEEMGEQWVAAFEQARELGGYVVDFLPLSKTDLSGPPTALPEDACQHVINSRSLLEALRDRGLLSAARATEATGSLGEEGREHEGHPIPTVGSYLFLDSGVSGVLAGAGLLDAACNHFTVHIDQQELLRVRAELHAYESNLETARWLTTLIDRLNRGLERGTYSAIVAPPALEEDSTINSQDPVLLCLETVLRYEPQQDVIWIDDRAVNKYPGRHGIPIVGVRDILEALIDVGAMREEEYYSTLARLRAANARFLPLNKKEILCHLRQARVQDGEVAETWELSVLRRYAAACLLREDILKRPEMTEGGAVANVGELPFIAQLERAVSEALTELWEGEEDEFTGRAHAEWLLANMYLGYAGVTNVAALPGSAEEERPKVASDLAHLTLRSIASGSSAGGEDQTRQWRLRWLEGRVLDKRFDADPGLIAMTANEVKKNFEETRGDMMQEATEQITEQVIAHSLGNLFEHLPDSIREELARDADFMVSVGRKNIMVIQIGAFWFDHEEFWRAAAEAANDRPVSVSTIGDDPVTFSLLATEEPGTLRLTNTETSENFTVSHGLLSVLLESTVAREKYLRENRHWFDCPEAKVQSAVAEIATTTDPLRRVREVESWRDSSAAFYYESLRYKLDDQEPVPLSELLPPDGGRLIEHLRLTLWSEDESSFSEAVELAANDLLREEGLQEASERFSGLPCPLPAALLSGVDALSIEEKRTLVKRLLELKGSPVSKIHLVRLLTHLGGEAYLRLARRVALSLTGDSGAEEWEAWSTVLQWTNDEFDARSDMRSLPTSLRLASVWYHAHKLLTISASAGLSQRQVLDSLNAFDRRLTSEVFKREDDYWQDMCHPRRVNRAVFVYTGLAYGYGDRGNGVIAEALESDFGDGYQKFQLLNDSSLARDNLGSFMGGNRAQTLSPLLGEQETETLAPTSLQGRLEEAIDHLGESGQEKLMWNLIYLLLNDQPPPEALRDRLQTALLNADIAALAREDVEAGLSALRTACLQAPNLASESLQSHLENQLVTVAGYLSELKRSEGITEVTPRDPEKQRELMSLLDSAVHLGNASPGDAVTTFGRLVDSVVDTWPGTAHFCKLVALRLCESLAPQEAKPLYKVLTRLRSR